MGFLFGAHLLALGLGRSAGQAGCGDHRGGDFASGALLSLLNDDWICVVKFMGALLGVDEMGADELNSINVSSSSTMKLGVLDGMPIWGIGMVGWLCCLGARLPGSPVWGGSRVSMMCAMSRS